MEFSDIGNDLEKAKAELDKSNLPEEYKKIAFSEITRKLVGGNQVTERGKPYKKKVYKHTTSGGKRENKENQKLLEESRQIIDSLSRSKYAVVYKLRSALEQALFILQVAEKEKSIRGLTPGQISLILKEVFKIIKTQAALSMALMSATELTDRKKIIIGKTFAYKYEIMHKGEEYLNKRLKEVNNQGLHVQKDTSLYDESDKVENE